MKQVNNIVTRNPGYIRILDSSYSALSYLKMLSSISKDIGLSHPELSFKGVSFCNMGLA